MEGATETELVSADPEHAYSSKDCGKVRRDPFQPLAPEEKIPPTDRMKLVLAVPDETAMAGSINRTSNAYSRKLNTNTVQLAIPEKLKYIDLSNKIEEVMEPSNS